MGPLKLWWGPIGSPALAVLKGLLQHRVSLQTYDSFGLFIRCIQLCEVQMGLRMLHLSIFWLNDLFGFRHGPQGALCLQGRAI